MGLVKNSSGCGREELFTSGEEWAKFCAGRVVPGQRCGHSNNLDTKNEILLIDTTEVIFLSKVIGLARHMFDVECQDEAAKMSGMSHQGMPTAEERADQVQRGQLL